MTHAEAATGRDGQRALVRRLFEEVWGAGRLEAADELVAPDCVVEAPGHREREQRELRGPNGLRELVETYRGGFPGLDVSVDLLLAEGDGVTARLTMRGVHRGRWLGVPASGREVDFTVSSFSRVSSGAVVRQWYEWDQRKLLEQLKLLPRI